MKMLMLSMRTIVLAGLAATATCTAPRPAVAPSVHTAAAYSIYDLDATWHDQNGAPVRLSTLRGGPRVLSLIYTHCASTCPMVVESMQRLEAKSDTSVRFVLISLDPERDSTGQLAAFARDHGLSSRWTLLRGSDDAVRELAATIGARYRRVSADEIAHTNTITVLDARGAVVAQQPSWDAAGLQASVLAAR